MGTKIDLSYDRRQTEARVSTILDRASTSVSVLKQIPSVYQSLPGCDLLGHEAATQKVEGHMSALSTKLSEVIALLQNIDEDASSLDERNKVLLATLSGVLRNKPEAALLKQITGPTARKKSGKAPTP